MNYTITTDFLIEHDITPDDYMLIKLLAERNFDTLSVIPILPDIQKLVDNDWLKEVKTDFLKMELTDEALDKLGILHENVEELAATIRGLWENTKMGTQSSPNAVLNRLRMFLRKFPEYDSDTIKVAAALYIEQQRQNAAFKYLKTTVNFILEQDTLGDYESALSSYCESVLKDTGTSLTHRRA